MQYFKIIMFLAAMALSGFVSGQQLQGSCGSVADDGDISLLLENKETLKTNTVHLRSGVQRYVPVTFHFVADDSENGYARPEQVLEQLASINSLYADQELTFYIDEFRYTADSRIYNTPSASTAEFQMRLKKDDDAMNIWMTQSAESGSNTPGTTLGYYSRSNDWIVIRKDEVSPTSGTLGHEIGHFFSLIHPHNGWDCEPYDEETHGNPVSSFFSPCNASVRVEFQDGSNCNNAGDFICDTPPDYMFGFGWSVGGDQCAPYDAGTMDPQGDLCDPMENNVMGYFIGCDDYMFSQTQKNLIKTDYTSSRRSYLRTGYVPNTDTIEDAVSYNYPINGEESPTYTQVELDWEDVDGADQYLVIIDRFSTFTLTPQRFIVNESNLVIPELEANRTYYWRVWPFNESFTGAGYSATQSFVTGLSSSVNEIRSVEDFNLYPNPAVGEDVFLTMRSTESFEARINIFNTSGQLVYESNEETVPSNGQWTKRIPTDGLNAGLYVVQVLSDEGMITSKLSIQ